MLVLKFIEIFNFLSPKLKMSIPINPTQTSNPIESKKRKFDETETSKLFCCKCKHRHYNEINYRMYKCKHCNREFCWSCFEKEHNSGNEKTRKTHYYNSNVQGLEQCSFCVGCDEQKNIDTYIGIVKPHHNLECLKCCVSENRYNITIDEIIKKKHALDNLKIKLDKDYRASINNISSNLDILNTLITTIPTEITNNLLMREKRLDQGTTRKNNMESTLYLDEYLRMTEIRLKEK